MFNNSILLRLPDKSLVFSNTLNDTSFIEICLTKFNTTIGPNPFYFPPNLVFYKGLELLKYMKCFIFMPQKINPYLQKKLSTKVNM